MEYEVLFWLQLAATALCVGVGIGCQAASWMRRQPADPVRNVQPKDEPDTTATTIDPAGLDRVFYTPGGKCYHSKKSCLEGRILAKQCFRNHLCGCYDSCSLVLP